MNDMFVRTTIEISDMQRVKLIALAAQRGEKGFSRLVQAAIDAYLDGEHAHDKTRQEALRLRGALSGRDAAGLAIGMGIA